MFPAVYQVPFHYANPVSGRASGTPLPNPPPAAAVSHVPPATDFGMPADIAAELRAIGARIEAQKTGELYAGLQPKEPYSWLEVTRDLHYGPAEPNVLDVFTVPQHGQGKPVVVFVHGGGFARGSKHTEGTPFYDNVGLWAASYGVVGVTVNYRLAPQSTWPSGIEDLAAAVAWLRANVAQYGGDPNRIVLWGHSAGAAHVADYLAHAADRGTDASVAGAVLTSGFYDLGSEVSVWKAYYGDDVATYAELDMFRDETAKLTAARAAAGKPVERVHLTGHSHIAETYAVGTGDRSLSGPVLDFVYQVSAP
jgi:triacylglycerol lipase